MRDRAKKVTIEQVNALDREGFVALIGGAFEESPWVAVAAWQKRPFENLDDLHRVMWDVVRQSGRERQVALIRAHPDLVGRAALSGSLTPESTREQASAGLDSLSPEEIARFEELNTQYREKFGFPFVICARENKKDAILAGFANRIKNSRETEIETALLEISKIARLRLQEIVEGN